MQESTGRESSKKKNESEQEVAGEDSEATSKETLSDLEESEENSGSSSSEIDPGPSPDGSFDESDELKDAGPM
jgi:hypothetical protein